MIVTSIQILDRGIPNQERLYFKAISAFDAQYLIVFLSTYLTPSSIATGGSKSYWFPPKTIRPGDHVFLYSGIGANAERLHTDGKTIHSFYWGLSETIWGQPNSCAVIFEPGFWQTTPQN